MKRLGDDDKAAYPEYIARAVQAAVRIEARVIHENILRGYAAREHIAAYGIYFVIHFCAVVAGDEYLLHLSGHVQGYAALRPVTRHTAQAVVIKDTGAEDKGRLLY